MSDVHKIADLETRVLRAIDLIGRLREENQTLRSSLETTQQRSHQQDDIVAKLRADHQNVEEVIVRTLSKLDGLEDTWAEIQQKDPSSDESFGVPSPVILDPPSPPSSSVEQGSLTSS